VVQVGFNFPSRTHRATVRLLTPSLLATSVLVNSSSSPMSIKLRGGDAHDEGDAHDPHDERDGRNAYFSIPSRSQGH
jgi:hypothetical protein